MKLEHAVRDLLKRKWAPQGGPFVRGTQMYQAMVLR
jgi:hypothetical protein